jgi:hypothetical protein
VSKKISAIMAAAVLAFLLLGSGTTVNDVGGTLWYAYVVAGDTDTIITGYDLRALGWSQVTKVGMKTGDQGTTLDSLAQGMRKNTVSKPYPPNSDDTWEISLKKVSEVIRDNPDSSVRTDTVIAYSNNSAAPGTTWIFIWGF